MDIPDGLIQQLALGRVVPFVGSGVSLAIRHKLFPTWSGLLESLAQRLHDEAHVDAAEIVRRYVKKGQLNKAANEVFDELAPAHFREVMQATFGVAQPRDADLDLPTALWSLRPRLIVTTNYDRVLQWSNSAARIATNSQRGNLADLFARSSADQPVVWHVHGHIDDADSLILAPRQYDRLYREATDDKHPYAAAWLQLRTLIGNHPLLFVGFGLQDEYVMDALATVLEIFGGTLRPSYALLVAGDDRARALWDKHKIHVLEYPAHGAPLVALVTELARRMSARSAEADDLGAGPAVIPEFLAAEQLARLNDDEEKLLNVFRQRAEQATWRPTLKILFARRFADPGFRAGVRLLERLLQAIDLGSLERSLGLALAVVDGVEILLGRHLKLQAGLLDQFRQLALTAIEQQVELKARVELARTLGRVGDPRVVDDLSDPAAWVEVPAGTYNVGDRKVAETIGKERSLSVASVTFARPFQLSRFPVTNGQFARFVAAGGYSDRSLWHAAGWKWRKANQVVEPRYWRDSKWNVPTQPVVGVSWWEADAFCRWAACPLPTECEWEAAARGPKGWAYPWGNDWRTGVCNTDEADLRVTTPVGIFLRSSASCGAHDMAGNVWEWCADTFDPARTDVPQAGRVARGGSWLYPGHCRSAVRLDLHPVFGVNFCGFRATRT